MRAILTDLGVAACLIKNEAILLVKEASGPQKDAGECRKELLMKESCQVLRQ